MKGDSQEAAGFCLPWGPAIISGTGRVHRAQDAGSCLNSASSGPTLGSDVHLLSPRVIQMGLRFQLERWENDLPEPVPLAADLGLPRITPVTWKGQPSPGTEHLVLGSFLLLK